MTASTVPVAPAPAPAPGRDDGPEAEVIAFTDVVPLPGPASTTNASAPAPVTAVVELAAGLTASTGVTPTADGWATGLTFGTDDVTLARASAADLADVAAVTGVTVDHGLRVPVTSADGEPTAIIAWGPTRGPVAKPAHVVDPIARTVLLAGEAAADGSAPVTRLLVGVVPPWLPDARVVLLTRGTLRVGGTDVHAVEIPTFGDPAGSGSRLYLAVAQPEIDLGGPLPRGVFLVSPDGSFLDVDGACAEDPELCASARSAGLDVGAELRAALR